MDHSEYAVMEFNDVDSNNLASYEERTRVLYVIQNIMYLDLLYEISTKV